MKSIFLTILFTVVFVPAINAQSQDFNEMAANGMDLIFNLKFDEANKTFDEMIRMYPENAIGYYLKSKNYFWMYALGNQNEELVKPFVDLSFEAIDASKKMLKKNRDDLDALFYMGTAYGYLGRYYAETDGFFKAFWYARKGDKYLKKALKKDPGYYDAYLGVGILHYYVDVLPSFIKSISFILGLAGDREKGVEEVTIASRQGHVTKTEAKFILAQLVYFEMENDYDNALKIYEELIEEYPDNHFLDLGIVQCYRSLSKYELAVQTLKNSLQSGFFKKYPKMETSFYRLLGNTYSDMNEHEKAIQAFTNVLAILKAQNRENSWEHEWSLYNIGDCYEILGDVDQAHAYYSKVSSEDKTGAYTQAQARLTTPLTPGQIGLTKGANYLKCGKYAQAGVIFNDLIAAELNKKPLNNAFIADLNFNIGRFEYETKEYQKSIQTFRDLLASNDIDKAWVKSWSHYYIGNCYKETGEFEKAEQEFAVAYKNEGNALRQAVDRARREMGKK